ncbi:Alpha/Beta hydrolase protein [Lasiosphaeria hispida]|uniref:Alpha/Beta hydrolase protein n=1 Tax=Lasiosphaeria hispida TaxID=260671 RepID=A0AAJ0HAZ1_9PEZI|nr:Alpha/Beta hydrolase protein [Lasiosphaeria hispida]
MSTRFSDGEFDVLGWDPRGVNVSRPAVECFPHDADRDRWYLLTSQHRAVVAANPRAQLEVVDAMNEAMFRACWERHGDLGRFLSTSFVARDLDEIRKALGEEEVTGYLVSYGTGIGQTYAGMFPDRVGRMILDGTEYVRDHRERGGFGWTALDNATNAWNDGFIGECLNAGPEYCALAKSKDGKAVTASGLSSRLDALLSSLIARPVPGYLKSTGPTMLTYSYLVDSIYSAMYSARRWPLLAQTFYELESGNATLAINRFESGAWWYDPELPCPEAGSPASDGELGNLVICADSYDASEPDDVDWWLSQWKNMTAKSWIAGNSRFYTVFPCRHFNTFWPKPSEVFRGDLNHTLRTPVLLIAETYDPATPLRNGRRLAAEMGPNARMIVHHGYGHSSVDTSNCTDAAAKAYILHGIIPKDSETDCYANEKPYLYGVTRNTTASVAPTSEPPIQVHGGGFGFRKHLGDGGKME